MIGTKNVQLARNLRAVVVGAAIAAFAGPASASAAMVDLKVSPSSPIVDDSVTVRFVVKTKLKPGYRYEAVLVGRSDGDCASFVAKTSKRNPAKGQTMSFTFSSYDALLNEGPEFCQGKASVKINAVKTRSSEFTGKGRMVGITEFRFRAKP